MMEIWHVAPATNMMQSAIDLGMRRFLISAYSLAYKTSRPPPKTRDLLRRVGARLFIDSGMISALKETRLDWADRQDRVVQYAVDLDADLVAHLDVPCEPWLLRKAGLTRNEALAITIRNARRFLDADFPTERKVYVLQGWTLADYENSLNEYADIGIPDGGRLGLGSCCMRPETRGLWPIIERIRELTKGTWLHSFGTGDQGKLWRLKRIGIDSVDEGNMLRRMIYRPTTVPALIDAYRGFDI